MSKNVFADGREAYALNMAGCNLEAVWRALGLQPLQEGQEEISPDILLDALDGIDGLPEPEIPTRGTVTNSGVTVIRCGLDQSYFRERFEALRVIAEDAKQRGVKVVII